MRQVMGIVLVFMIMMSQVACKKNEPYQYQFTTADACQMSEELSVDCITEGVMLVKHSFPWEANSLVIEMKNSDIVLVDTPYTYDATKELVEWIRKEVGSNRKMIAINTGFHFDNLGGNGYLKEAGIKIYGTSKTVDQLHERGESSREWFLDSLSAPNYKAYYTVYKDLAYVDPSEVFSLKEEEEKVLSFGNESLILYYPGESHSPDNIVVYYPQKEILFGGCMVKELSSKDLGNVADANLEQWPISIEKLKAKYNEENVKYLVPGHGQIGDIGLLDKTLDLFK